MEKITKLIQQHAKKLVYVDSSASLKKICTLFLSEEISYLPIIDNGGTRTVGVYKRKDLFTRFIEDSNMSIDEVDKSEFKRSALVDFPEDKTLQEIMSLLVEHSALLLKSDGVYTHLVTPKVVASALEKYSDQFLIYETLEKTIRILFKKQGIQLAELHHSNLDKPFPDKLDELDFGQYRIIFSRKWDSLGLMHLDKKTVMKLLDSARDYRNALMHFRLKEDSSGLEDAKKLNKILSAVVKHKK